MDTKEKALGITLAVAIFAGIWGLAIVLENWSADVEAEREAAPTLAAQARHDSTANWARLALSQGNYERSLQFINAYLQQPEVVISNKEIENLQQIVLSEVSNKATFWSGKQEYDSAAYYYNLGLLYGSKKWYKGIELDSILYAMEHSSNPSQAVLHVEKFIVANPLDYSLLLKKSHLCLALQQKREALETLDHATKLIIKDYVARYGKGYAMVINPKEDSLPTCHEQIFREYAKLLKEYGEDKKAASNKYWADFLAGKV